MILTLCSVVYFSLFATPPLLHTFFLSLLLLLNLFLCSTRLFSLLLNVFGHAHSACAASYPTLLHPPPPPSPPSFLTPNWLFPFFPFSLPILAYIGWITAVYLALCLHFNLWLSFTFPSSLLHFSAVSALNLHRLLFCSPLFFHILSSSFSLSFSHFFFLEPLTIFMPLLSPPFPLWAPASPGQGSYPPRPFCETAVPSSCFSPLAL